MDRMRSTIGCICLALGGVQVANSQVNKCRIQCEGEDYAPVCASYGNGELHGRFFYSPFFSLSSKCTELYKLVIVRFKAYQPLRPQIAALQSVLGWRSSLKEAARVSFRMFKIQSWKLAACMMVALSPFVRWVSLGQTIV